MTATADKMSARDLARALRYLGDHLELVGYATYGRRGSAISVAEAVAHELAHHLLSGPDFERELREMSDRVADRHEASALRVEVAALGRLGIGLPLRTLWKRANWRTNRQPRISSTGTLTRRESRCVDRMVRMIRRASSQGCAPLPLMPPPG